jgi:hypothetical protein
MRYGLTVQQQRCLEAGRKKETKAAMLTRKKTRTRLS